VNLRIRKSVGPHDIEYQVDEAIHVFAASDACAFALVGLAGVELLLFRRIPIQPESFYGFAGLLLVVDKIKGHLFSITTKGGSFFRTQSVQLESSDVACLHVA
jgi:hypothetical protein